MVVSEINEEAAINEFRDMFGISDDSTEPEETTEETTETTEATTETETGSGSETTETTENNNSSGVETPAANKSGAAPDDTKSAKAFARMRTENAAMQKTLNKLAQALGLEGKLPADQAYEIMDKRLNEVLAKKNNIDPAIYARLERLESDSQELNRLRAERVITEGISNIQKKYNATEDDMSEFISGLIQKNYDVMAPGADLENEFIRQNFQKIMENKVKEAVQKEQKRAASASEASKPATKQGQSESSTEPSEINSMADFEKFLNSLK